MKFGIKRQIDNKVFFTFPSMKNIHKASIMNYVLVVLDTEQKQLNQLQRKLLQEL